MNKRASINDLLLRIFIFVVIYQVITHWNTTQEMANTVPTQANNEMNDIAERYWSKYMCRKNDSFFVVKRDFPDDENALYELKEVNFKGYQYNPTPADKLNHIEETGSLYVNAIASRHYKNKEGKWTEWENYRPYMNVGLKKIHGEWQVENQEKYLRPDCSSVPQ